jgi:hypothetical protein
MTERTERTERDKHAGSRLSLSVFSVLSVLYIFSAIALPNSLVLSSVAPDMRRSKS